MMEPILVKAAEVGHHNLTVHAASGQIHRMSFFDMHRFNTDGRVLRFSLCAPHPVKTLMFEDEVSLSSFLRKFLLAKYHLYAQLYLSDHPGCGRGLSIDDDIKCCVICLDAGEAKRMECCGCAIHIGCFSKMCTLSHFNGRNVPRAASVTCPWCRSVQRPFLNPSD